MRVKRLEIQGFKSFKDKTVVHFDHGITGIVGPNGCGKSNIVDAFFWVMGEQSYKHMRGSGSDDLIFNGSSKFSPLGLAEATLVMETDAPDTENGASGASVADIPVHLRAKEVSVTRRLYRSGEGEYFINGVPARLKDIQELFMDTGVGAKGYSVIEQGQIGKIVNSKPEERRLLVEEAAGIAKYKARKRESLRKMEATQGNLSRLSDVIQEIERSLGSLERQAQKARLYRKYKDELLDKELSWGRRKIQVIRQKLEGLKATRDALEQELVGLRAELQTTENNLEQDRVVQLTDTKTAEELQTKVQGLSDELTREQSALELSRRRRGDLASQLEALERERVEVQASIANETERFAERDALVGEANEAHAKATERAREVETQASALRTEAEQVRRSVDGAKRELMESIRRASDLTSKNASLMSQIEGGQLQLARLGQAVETQAERLEQAKQDEAHAKTQTESLRVSRDEKTTARKAQAELARTLERKLHDATRAREDSLRALAKVKSKLQSLEELDSAHEGFGDGTRAALDWAKGKGELFGLADAFEVAPEHDTAIAGWLESRLDGLATSDAALAVNAIEHVQAENQGRVAIHVPVAADESSFGARESTAVSAKLSSAGLTVVGELAALVKISAKLKGPARGAAERALVGVMVVESLSPLAGFLASSAAASLGAWSLVALDGAAFHAGGFVAGGKLEGDGGIAVLRRKRQIADLGVEATHVEQSHREAEALVETVTAEVEAARTTERSLQTDLQTIEIQLAALERDLHQASRSLREAEGQLEQTREEMTELRERGEAGRAEREGLEAQVKELAARREELEARAEAGDAEFAVRDAAAREKGAELQGARIEEASLRERAIGLRRELEMGRTVIADRERRLAEIGRTLDRASTERAEFDGGEGDLVVRIEELTRTVADARAELFGAKDRLEQSGAKINGALDRIKELHRGGDAKAGEANQLALELEKLASDDAHLVQNLEEKYGQGCLERPVTSPIQEEMTEPVVTAEMTADEELALSDEVERLRERIRRLGDVNPSAVEEFEEVKKRHDYLHKERADLEQSIQNLQDAIEHINKTSEERFRRAFDAIADRFERLFPIIFGGGQAKLSLVYPEGSSEILEAGVDILAQPPGKKVQNISLLSGGEKALTAVSLIFAIFMVKPSPFCVLDEVDAPLDDANIGKFNALLREMAAKSQFIVITHNKKTMELNDTLYGVTMEEPGVSKMVSIELR